jgi:hypothetical protein
MLWYLQALAKPFAFVSGFWELSFGWLTTQCEAVLLLLPAVFPSAP